METEIIGLNTHQITALKTYQAGLGAEEMFYGLQPSYHHVTPEEAERAIEAHRLAIKATENNTYQDIAEDTPGLLCQACWRADCPDQRSVVNLVTHDAQQRQERWEKAMERFRQERNPDRSYQEGAKRVIEIFGELSR